MNVNQSINQSITIKSNLTLPGAHHSPSNEDNKEKPKIRKTKCRHQISSWVEYAMFSLEYFKCKTLIHDSKTLLYHEPGESKQIHNKSTRQTTKSFSPYKRNLHKYERSPLTRPNATNRSQIERKKQKMQIYSTKSNRRCRSYYEIGVKKHTIFGRNGIGEEQRVEI